MKIGFIGAGKVATTLAMGFATGGQTVAAVASRSNASAEAMARRVPGCAACDDAQAVADAADLVFLTVPDDAIAPTAAALRWRAGVAAVHCSGATDLAALAPARERGAAIGSFHPMQMFADADAALATLPGATITIVGDAPLVETLDALARTLGGRPLRLAAENRALFHGSAAFVGPFTIALLRAATTLWRDLGVEEPDALAALIPLLRGTIAAVEAAGLAGGMGGPVSRGDLGTIRKHLAALDAADPEIAALYRTLSLRTLPLALERGTLDPETAASFRDLFVARDTHP